MIQSVPPRLAEVLKKAEALIGSVESAFDGGTVFTVEERLRSEQSLEEDRDRRVRINYLLTELQHYYQAPAASKRDADAQVLVHDTQASAYLTLVPPRPGGHMPSFADVMANVTAAGITHGVNHAILEAAFQKFQKKNGMIYAVKFADCTLPRGGEAPKVKMRVAAFQKAPLFASDKPFTAEMPAEVATVASGQIVADVMPGSAGSPGVSVRGESIPAIGGGTTKVSHGDGLKTSPDGRQIVAAMNGVLVAAGEHLDVVPFYVVSGDLAAEQSVAFNGNVFVTGNIYGPIEIRCEDLYVGGSMESATVDATGDLYIQGGIVGKRVGRITTTGSVFTRFISDGTVEAMGDILARDSITYSDVTSNGRIVVASTNGTIFGGTVAALKEISATKIGSEFGSYTTTIAGKDFLTKRQLDRIDAKIRGYEETLYKIDLIKKKLSDTKGAPGGASAQDVIIALLQKEIKAREELASLKRSKEKFDKAMKDFLTASIRAIDQLNPPVKVQICSAVEEITKRMNRVVLVLDRENKVFAMKQEG